MVRPVPASIRVSIFKRAQLSARTLPIYNIMAIIHTIVILEVGEYLPASMAFHGVWNFVFMGALSLGTEESLTALVSYVAESPAYLVILLELCVGFLALLFWKRTLSLKRE